MQASALAPLLKFTGELEEIEKKTKDQELQILIQHCEKVEPLYVERQTALKEIPNFWSSVLGSPETPLSELMNGTFDNKITRAITDFQVKTRAANGTLMHKVVVSFGNNIMIEAGEIYREMDGNGKTISIQPIKWKKGTENLRTNSLFSFFDENPSGGDQFVQEALDAFRMTFEDPFLATEPDN